jgi:hypothetical protein
MVPRTIGEWTQWHTQDHVALARKLLIALWRMVMTGEIIGTLGSQAVGGGGVAGAIVTAIVGDQKQNDA